MTQHGIKVLSVEHRDEVENILDGRDGEYILLGFVTLTFLQRVWNLDRLL
jgi:hypothetical protein